MPITGRAAAVGPDFEGNVNDFEADDTEELDDDGGSVAVFDVVGDVAVVGVDEVVVVAVFLKKGLVKGFSETKLGFFETSGFSKELEVAKSGPRPLLLLVADVKEELCGKANFGSLTGLVDTLEIALGGDVNCLGGSGAFLVGLIGLVNEDLFPAKVVFEVAVEAAFDEDALGTDFSSTVSEISSSTGECSSECVFGFWCSTLISYLGSFAVGNVMLLAKFRINPIFEPSSTLTGGTGSL